MMKVIGQRWLASLALTGVGLRLSGSPAGRRLGRLSPTTLGVTTNDDVTHATTTSHHHRAETEDISGPCDEAEHRNDPRCTGAVSAPPGRPTTATDAASRRCGQGSRSRPLPPGRLTERRRSTA